MGKLNDMIAAFNPAAALRREMAAKQYRAVASVGGADTRWRGASKTLRSLRSWVTRHGSARSDLPSAERTTLAARSRDAFRNHAIARSAVMRSRTAIVGTGLRPGASVDWKTLGLDEAVAKELNGQIDRYWRLYATDPRECDAEATLDAYQLQACAIVAAMLSGDCFALTPYRVKPGCVFGTKLQLIDGARVSNPDGGADTDKLVAGVELDDLGAPVRYHVSNQHPGDSGTGSLPTWQAVDVFGRRTGERRALHVWNDKIDIGAVRGAPFLAPILEPLAKMEQYSQAELTAAVVASLMTVFIEQDKANNESGSDPTEEFESPEDANATLSAGEIALGSGAIVALAPGEKANLAAPGRPNPNFEPFLAGFAKLIGAALEIPVEEILLHYSSSYSAARAAMLQAWRFYVTRRQWLVTQLCDPWRDIWFDELVASGKIDAKDYGDPIRRAAYQRCTWTGPARGAIDEYKEAMAAKVRIDNHLSNRHIESQQMNGIEWDEIAETAENEIEFLRERGMLILTPGAAVAVAPEVA